MKKGKDFEGEYFVREDAQSKHILHEKKRRQLKKEIDEQQKALHYLKCPKCGHDMELKQLTYIEVEQCSSCGAIVLDREDIDAFVAEKRSLLNPLIDFFK